MGTQKTGIRGGDDVAATEIAGDPSEDAEVDLGIPEDGGIIIDDPSGFVADAPVTNLLGRRVRPMSSQELQRAHNMQAGNVPMFGQPSVTDKDGRMSEEQAQPSQEQPVPNRQSQSKAESMMPDFLRGAPPPQREEAPQQQPEAAARSSYERAATAVHSAAFDETANMLQHLIDQEIAARNRGDYRTAAQARAMAEQLTESFQLKRASKKREEHPSMKRLKAELGLEQIKPAEVEWAGFKWQFAATNSRLDMWVTETLRQDGMNVAALMISAAIVGIDGIPIYDFLGVALEEEYTLTAKDKAGRTKKVVSKIYRKFCNCGIEVDIDATTCPSCKRSHNPFDIPTDLRERCAIMFYNFLENDFGPYEELPILLDLKSELMKDRRMDKAELYPLAMPSLEVNMMTDSQSGDE